jgi:site-specific DNA recombinase
LGYDVDPDGLRLRVNRAEARRVRAIFALYLRYQGLVAVAKELARRGWVNKAWQTRQGKARGGRPFTKPRLYDLLNNVTYIGQVRYKDEVHPGEHESILDLDTWQRVQALLQREGRSGRLSQEASSGPLLKGLLRCAPCGCAMTPSHACKNGAIRYRYYVCGNAQRRGWHVCPSKSLSAPAIEQFVLERLRGVANDPAFLKEALAETADPNDSLLAGGDAAAPNRAVTNLARALAGFTHIWETLALDEQVRLLRLAIERVEYDGHRGKAMITFRRAGLMAWVAEWARYQEHPPC